MYLASAESDHKVSDEGVLCLSRTVADHHTPSIRLGHLTAKQRKTETKHITYKNQMYLKCILVSFYLKISTTIV